MLLQGCSSALYDTSCTWEESHETFHHAFAAFPWEVVYMSVNIGTLVITSTIIIPV